MTTINLHVHKDDNYQPPQALSFTSAISNAWNKSIAALEVLFKG